MAFDMTGMAEKLPPSPPSSSCGDQKNASTAATTSLLDFTPTQWTLPFSAAVHGCEMTTVHVGAGQAQRTFAIHRNLLLRASAHFERMDKNWTTFTYNRHCPVAFEVIYQYLYSGRIVDDGYLDERTGCLCPGGCCTTRGTHWLQLYRLAEYTEMAVLRNHAFEQIKMRTLPEARAPPSNGLIKELYAPHGCEGTNLVKEYFIDWVAYQLSGTSSISSWLMHWYVDTAPEFAKEVLRRLIALSQPGHGEFTLHPSENPKYAPVETGLV